MNLGQSIRDGVKWLAFGKVGNRLLEFAFGVALARLLVPADFGMIVTIQTYEGEAMAVTLPATVTMLLTEADPVVKGQTASSSYKPAMLENGRKVLVPPFIEAGTRIVVDTTEGTYVERAKD